MKKKDRKKKRRAGKKRPKKSADATVQRGKWQHSQYSRSLARFAF